jgi:hypothetical protein
VRGEHAGGITLTVLSVIQVPTLVVFILICSIFGIAWSIRKLFNFMKEKGRTQPGVNQAPAATV